MTDAAGIKEQLRLVQLELIVTSKRYSEVKQLFDASCFVGDGEQAAKYREELHGLLDMTLDHVGSLMALSRQLICAGS